MAIVTYVGNGQATAEVDTFTPANVAATNTFTLTCNGKTVTFVATLTTVASVTAGLYALLTSTTNPPPTEFTDGGLVWTDNGTNLQLTGKASGEAVTITSSASGGTAALTKAQVTAATGPNDGANVLNYSSGSLPAASDTLIFDARSPSLLDGLAAITNVLTLVDIRASFTGTIGRPIINPLGYTEYRATYATLKTATLRIGAGDGQGSNRLVINGGATSCALQVYKTGSSADQGYQALRWKGSGTNTVDLIGGTVDIAPYGGDTGAISAITQNGGTIHCPSWIIPVTVTQSGGQCNLDGAWSGAYTLTGGSATILGVPAATSLSLQNGTMVYSVIGGTVGTLTLNPNGILDKSQDISASTFTNCTINGGQILRPDVLVFTNPIAFGTYVRNLQVS